jgi:hypothetical protein
MGRAHRRPCRPEVMNRATEQEDLSVLIYRYEGIHSEALSQREPLELIKETLQRWTN